MKKTSILLFLLTLFSCNEFSDRNLVERSNDGANDRADITTKELVKNFEDIKGTDIPTDQLEEQIQELEKQVTTGEFSLEKMLMYSGLFVVGPVAENLYQEIETFNQNYHQYCQHIDVISTLNSEILKSLRTPVQDQWKKVMIEYHRLAAMNFGPGKAPTSTAMDSIYTFNHQDKCRVEFGLVQYAFRNRLPRFDVIDNYNVRGLDSLEALIFANPEMSLCERVSGSVQKWLDQSFQKKEQDRCAYGKHLLKDITNKSNELYTSWAPHKENFTTKMVGQNLSPIEWVNEMTAALFTLDTVTKDVKLSYPAGFDVMVNGKKTQCGDITCASKREHPFSNFSLQALKASLEGFRAIFFGLNFQNNKQGMSFDDLLIARGFAPMAAQIDRDSKTLIEKLEKLNDQTTFEEMLTDVDQTACLETTSENRKVEACALVWDIRKLTDVLKVDFMAALQELSAPKQAIGDND